MAAIPSVPLDLSKPEARTYRSTFGGGWIVPLSDRATVALASYYGEPPAELPPIREIGWIVEPDQSADIYDLFRSEGIAWEVQK